MKRILLVIDVQRDFCEGGGLAVANGRNIIANINLIMERARCDAVIATQDWHPAGHVSFASTHGKKPFETITVSYGEQMLWPDHCVQGTALADFHPELDMRPVQFIVRKGYRAAIDSYSGFFENDKKTDTGLHGLIATLAGSDAELVLVGIATDVCVLHTALDARTILKYERVRLVEDACAGVTPAGTAAAVRRMRDAGISIVQTQDLL